MGTLRTSKGPIDSEKTESRGLCPPATIVANTLASINLSLLLLKSRWIAGVGRTTRESSPGTSIQVRSTRFGISGLAEQSGGCDDCPSPILANVARTQTIESSFD